jgi:predicted HicB family RNase H-like nuclease
LKPKNPISLLPVLTDDEQFLCLEHASWSLDVFATTRAELLAELKEQMLMLWQEYACEQDEALSEPAQQVKQQLLADWEETAHETRRETLTQRTALSRHFIEEDRQLGLHHARA